MDTFHPKYHSPQAIRSRGQPSRKPLMRPDSGGDDELGPVAVPEAGQRRVMMRVVAAWVIPSSASISLIAGQALGDEQHLALAEARASTASARCCWKHGRRCGAACGPRGETAPGAEQRPPLVTVRTASTRTAGRVLEQEAAGAGTQGAQDVVVDLEHGQDKDAHGRERCRVGTDPVVASF